MDWMALRGGNTTIYGDNRQHGDNIYNRSSIMALSMDTKPNLALSMNNNENYQNENDDDDDDDDDVIKSGLACDDVIKDDDSDDGNGSDAEGIWSADIEQSFLEALAIYPPCGRRKIILSDEGKMYGRNELIARYIKLRTGKTRTRKQVSSHIQVLARRKSKEIQSHIKDQTSRERVLQSLASMSSSQIVSATSLHHRHNSTKSMVAACKQMTSSRYTAANANQVLQYGTSASESAAQQPVSQFWTAMDQRITQIKQDQLFSSSETFAPDAQAVSLVPAAWQGSKIIAPHLQLVDFTSFVALSNQSNKLTIDIQQVQDKFPDTSDGLRDLHSQGPDETFFLVKFLADLNTTLPDEPGAYYGVTYQFESSSNITLSVSTKVCSFGKQVIEKIETECASCCDHGRYVYCVNRSPMCEYMLSFIDRLRNLPESYMMNSVLENFTVLQTIRNQETQQLLLCVAYMFEVSAEDRAAECNIYRIVND